MFGTLKPRRCGLRDDERATHRTLYCGLCQSLGQHHGQSMRPLVSFDAVFLAVIADGLSEQQAAPSKTRCPMVPVLHRNTVDPDSTAMRFATHVSVLLADQRLADKAEEGHWSRFARPLVAGPAAVARARLAEMGVDLSDLEGFEQRQSRAERGPEVTPEQASAPTEEALGRVFGSITSLPDIPESARGDLQRLGAAVGRIIYFVDALEDLRKDLRRGDFNPCLDPLTRRLDPQRRQRCTELLEGALDEAASALALLPWRRHRGIAANVVAVEQRRRAKEAILAASSLLPTPRFDLRAIVMRPLLVAWLWWWIVGPARADEPKSDGVEEGSNDGEAETKSLWEELSALWNALIDGCTDTCNACASGCSDCTDCGSECSTCGDECGQSCTGCDQCCNDCGKSCGDCGTACDDCGKGCNDCGSGCNDCGNGCNDCGKGCNDCGNCCNGCNDCNC